MNWYLKSIEKEYKNKLISGLTSSGDFVKGKFESVRPDILRGHVFLIKDMSNRVHEIKSSNVRKIDEQKETKEEQFNDVKANFCGYLVRGVSPQTKSKNVHTRIMTTKEPHTLKTIRVVVPSSHIINEDK